MDRTTGANYITVGGKRQFTDGPPGTTVTGAHMTALQEEIMACIEGAGITPDANTLTQLRDAIFATVSAGGFFGVPAIGLSIGSGGEGAWVSGGNSTMEGEHHFTDFTLNSAHQLSVGSTGILIIRCTGTATINGSVNGAGTSGVDGSALATPNGGVGGGGGGAGEVSAAGAGGSGGGIWSTGGSAFAGPGVGGSGKNNPLLLRMHTGIVGGSGGSAAGNAGGSPGGSLRDVEEWSICSLLNMGVLPIGGGGGGGATSQSAPAGGGGGGGGGFILLVASEITGSGYILCDGGSGGNGYQPGPNGAGGGGGGGGGIAILVSKNNPASITISANGGSAGAGSGTGENGSAGENGFANKYHP